MDRVLRPGGVIAVFGYHFHEPVGCAGAEEFTALRKSIFEEGDFAESWDPRKKLIVDEEYKTIPQFTYEEKERSVDSLSALSVRGDTYGNGKAFADIFLICSTSWWAAPVAPMLPCWLAEILNLTSTKTSIDI